MRKTTKKVLTLHFSYWIFFMCTHMCVFVSFCFEFICICIILFCICILEFLESYYLHFPDPPQPCSGSHWGSKSSSLDQVESSLVDTGDQTQNVFITVVIIIIMMSMTILMMRMLSTTLLWFTLGIKWNHCLS